ncbi:two-component system LytT family response regulator [Hymenobacter luteus]|uniref:Two-component system LytT family response regulator n=2 Tax=Hymenobacter TaxID=89966 RepID=A0A7W9SXZ4_9BACT|nr:MULTISPECIES: LytTR family DNA-binding domain-containing protein [Hymenobacter]MBB4599714.1 two-component system LytT family response regulator [Hymenobacter latericoloratus]MBB6057976.1 two-component system LytT family response regulator [Hymenobacter luteus]RPD49645.1 DNA-binding response regulator [Hymenobacter sediminis]
MTTTPAPVRCLIVDDEPLAHQVLTQFIGQTPGLTLTGKCRNAMEAYEHLAQQPVDLLFLDIEMPLMTGLDFLRNLRQPPKTVLTTAYREYAYEGYELDVLDYLLKPFSYERFMKAISRLPALQPAPPAEETAEKYLLVKERQGLLKVPHRDIIYVEGCKDYVKLMTATKTYLLHQTMKEMVEILGPSYLRVHRSFIVAAAHIKLLQPDTVQLLDATLIPIGNSYKADLLAFFKK